MGRRQVLQDFFFPAIQLKVCPTQNLLKTIRGVTLTVQNANTAGSFNWNMSPRLFFCKTDKELLATKTCQYLSQ